MLCAADQNKMIAGGNHTVKSVASRRIYALPMLLCRILVRRFFDSLVPRSLRMTPLWGVAPPQAACLPLWGRLGRVLTLPYICSRRGGRKAARYRNLPNHVIARRAQARRGNLPVRPPSRWRVSMRGTRRLPRSLCSLGMTPLWGVAPCGAAGGFLAAPAYRKRSSSLPDDDRYFYSPCLGAPPLDLRR